MKIAVEKELRKRFNANNMSVPIENKKIIIFDLDGTLTPSKSTMDDEMSDLICGLLMRKKVAVISGGAWRQFTEQFVGHLRCSGENLLSLFLFPTTATRFYKYNNCNWEEVYSDKLDSEGKAKIKDAFKKAFVETGYVHPTNVYGEIIEDRETQISFSALGQDIVEKLGERGLQEKKKWNEENQGKRMEIISKLTPLLPEYSVHAGGLTTIDVTKKGIDKAYGIRKIEELLEIPITQMLFVGDALYPGGNDYAAIESGVKTIAVSGPEETKKLLEGWLK